MDDDAELKMVKSFLRSVLISAKEGVPAENLQKEYKEMVGNNIPILKLQFQSLESFIQAVPDVVRSTWRGGKLYYIGVPDKTTAHIHKLVSKQRDKRKPRQQMIKRDWTRYGGNTTAKSEKRNPEVAFKHVEFQKSKPSSMKRTSVKKFDGSPVLTPDEGCSSVSLASSDISKPIHGHNDQYTCTFRKTLLPTPRSSASLPDRPEFDEVRRPLLPTPISSARSSVHTQRGVFVRPAPGGPYRQKRSTIGRADRELHHTCSQHSVSTATRVCRSLLSRPVEAERPLLSTARHDRRPLLSRPVEAERPLLSTARRDRRPLLSCPIEAERPLLSTARRDIRPLLSCPIRADRPLLYTARRNSRPLLSCPVEAGRSLPSKASIECRPLLSDHFDVQRSKGINRPLLAQPSSCSAYLFDNKERRSRMVLGSRQPLPPEKSRIMPNGAATRVSWISSQKEWPTADVESNFAFSRPSFIGSMGDCQCFIGENQKAHQNIGERKRNYSQVSTKQTALIPRKRRRLLTAHYNTEREDYNYHVHDAPGNASHEDYAYHRHYSHYFPGHRDYRHHDHDEHDHCGQEEYGYRVNGENYYEYQEVYGCDDDYIHSYLGQEEHCCHGYDVLDYFGQEEHGYQGNGNYYYGGQAAYGCQDRDVHGYVGQEAYGYHGYDIHGYY